MAWGVYGQDSSTEEMLIYEPITREMLIVCEFVTEEMLMYELVTEKMLIYELKNSEILCDVGFSWLIKMADKSIVVEP